MSVRFVFDSRLDTRFLDSFYEGNIEYAIYLFEIYITSHYPAMEKCREVFSSEEDGNELMIVLVHTRMNGFSMVGLTRLEAMRNDLETLVRQGEITEARQIFSIIYEEFHQTFPLIQEEYKRLKDFVEQYSNC